MFRILVPILGLFAALWLLQPRHDAGAAELLVNGGFEEGAGGWSWLSGDVLAVASPVRGGAWSGRFQSASGQPSVQDVRQTVPVQPNGSYEFSGWVLLNDPAVQQVSLRVTWLRESGDSTGENSSSYSLTTLDVAFQSLTTGQMSVPPAAVAAQVKVRVQTAGSFLIYLDDFSLTGPPPQATPTPSPPASSPTPAPVATPTSTATPVPPATSTPVPSSEAEPAVFPALVNGGFEQLRADGTPYGWRKQGGEMGVTAVAKVDGTRALSLASTTIATKWVYQAVTVHGGAHYEASAYGSAITGVDAIFVRLSWYASDDGGGQAIDQADSAELTAGTGFQHISTGPVQAPPDARTARIRLMLRPSSASPAIAYFDAASFAPSTVPLGAPYEAAGDAQSGRPPLEPGFSAGGGVPPADAAVAGAVATPARLANVRRDGPEPPIASIEGGGRADWAIALAIGSPLVALASLGALEVWGRRRLARAHLELPSDGREDESAFSS